MMEKSLRNQKSPRPIHKECPKICAKAVLKAWVYNSLQPSNINFVFVNLYQTLYSTLFFKNLTVSTPHQNFSAVENCCHQFTLQGFYRPASVIVTSHSQPNYVFVNKYLHM